MDETPTLGSGYFVSPEFRVVFTPPSSEVSGAKLGGKKQRTVGTNLFPVVDRKEWGGTTKRSALSVSRH